MIPSLLLASPQILAAFAMAVRAGSDELDLRTGTHLRVYAGLGPSFPVAPLLVHGFSPDAEERHCSFFIADPQGPGAEAEGFMDIILNLQEPRGWKTTSITLEDHGGAFWKAALLDQANRVIAVREKPPFVFSAPVLHKLRIWGNADVLIWQRLVSVVGGAIDIRPLSVLGLPIEGAFPWYLGVQNRGHGFERVERGAPNRLNPMDRPFGNLDTLSPGDEVNRVEAMLSSFHVDGGIDALIARLVSGDKAPWLESDSMAPLEPTSAGAPQQVTMNRQGILQLAAADPGMARYLGFADTIAEPAERWSTLLVQGLFAVSIEEFKLLGPDFSELAAHSATGPFVESFADSLGVETGMDHRAEIQRVAQHVIDAGYAIAPLQTLLEPVPPWLPPVVPAPQIFQTRWQASIDAKPSRFYRASFAFPDLPLASISGLARVQDGEWRRRNETLLALDRAVPRLFGFEADTRLRETDLGVIADTLEPAAILADYDIDADQEPTTFAAWAGDCFGRFPEDTAPFTLRPPERPSPPPPVLRFNFVRHPGEIPPGQSPGVVELRVAVRPLPVQQPGTTDEAMLLSSAIVVPGLSDLQAGARELAYLRIGIGQPDGPEIGLLNPGMTEHELIVPALTDPVTGFELVGCFLDTDGRESEWARAHFEVRNFRAPIVLNTGIGLVWSSDPGPSPDVEVRLEWPAPPAARYRVYLADQAALGIAPGDLTEDPPGATSRGLVAAKGADRQGNKKHFLLLTDTPVEAVGAAATAALTLPRSLESVQFLRVVPLGSDGEEADFDTCGVVAVAVPESRRPPPPRLEGSIDPDSGAAILTVSSDAVDLIALQRDEPGLFQPGEPGTNPPTATLRRAVGGVVDPIYARHVGVSAQMRQGAAGAPFRAELRDDNAGRALEHFVKYVYWAEWRMPPERRLPAEYIERAGQITPVNPACGLDHPRPLSLPSAPRVLMRVPATAPAAPGPAGVVASLSATAAADIMQLRITLVHPPIAHRLAVAPFKLAAWTQWQTGPIEPLRKPDGSSYDGDWPSLETGEVTALVAKPVDAGTMLKLRVAIVDPVGRMSDIDTIEVE